MTKASGPIEQNRPTSGPSMWRVKVARFGYMTRFFELLARGASTFRSAVPIGLLNTPEIEFVVSQTYEKAPDFYSPEKYLLRYETELLPVLRRLLPRQDGPNLSLLDLYCGQGREAEIFALDGYEVTGVDRLAGVVDQARHVASRRGYEAKFVVADIDDWQPLRRDWDVVYTSLWMYSTIPDSGRRVAWLRRLSEWVAPNGLLIVSARPIGSDRQATAAARIAGVVAKLTRNDRTPEFGDRFDAGLFWHDIAERDVMSEHRQALLVVEETVEIKSGAPCVFFVARPAGE